MTSNPNHFDEALRIRLHAQQIRRRLEGRVNAELLARLSDEELVLQERRHHAQKLAWAREDSEKKARRQ